MKLTILFPIREIRVIRGSSLVSEVKRRLSVVVELELEAVVSANFPRAFTGKLLTADDADNADKK
jgi:hypothetical protein